MPARPKRRPHLLRPLRLSGPHLAPPPGILIPPLLVLRLRNQRGTSNRCPSDPPPHTSGTRTTHAAASARRTSSTIARTPTSMTGPKRPVHARLQNQQVAHMHRSHKVQVVHARRHHDRPRMPDRRHRADQVDKLHQPPAKQIPQRIRVRRKDNLAALRLRLRHRPSKHRLSLIPPF